MRACDQPLPERVPGGLNAVRHRRALYRGQGQVLRRGLSGQLHLRGRGSVLHPSRRVHRLPGLRGGVSGPGDLPGQHRSREVETLHREEQGLLREQVIERGRRAARLSAPMTRTIGTAAPILFQGALMTVGALPSREQALALLHEWIQNPGLRKHCYAVEAAMRAYARTRGEDEERWGLTGLIHDFDWERHPDAERH